jgi:hypothetical protein
MSRQLLNRLEKRLSEIEQAVEDSKPIQSTAVCEVDGKYYIIGPKGPTAKEWITPDDWHNSKDILVVISDYKRKEIKAHH